MVPPYQRPYAWTTEHAGELLDDLLGFMEDGDEPVDKLNPYFLGSIVLIKGDGPEAHIVDGQQRLVTLIILLSALRATVPESFAHAITKVLYEPADPLANTPARYRLRLKDRDTAFFQEFIQHEGGIIRINATNASALSDSQRNVRENALLFLDRLADLAEAQRIRLAQFIVQRCLLVAVSTPDLDSAYRIFSVLNDRGLDLSYTDILKAELIGRVPLPVQPEYTTKWEDMEESLGRDNMEALLSHIRMIVRKQRTRETVLKEFRDYVIPSASDPQHLIDETLLPYASAFEVILNTDYRSTRGAESVNQMLFWLKRITDVDWLPPAIFYLARYSHEPERLARFLVDLERLAASLMIRRLNASKRIDRYGKVLAAIEAGENLGAPQSPLQLTDGERIAVLQALEGDVYKMYSRTRQYVLLRLDASLADTSATYEYSRITVEHVLPQNPSHGSEWTKWFPTTELREQWVHRVGNLVLLSRTKNTQAGNYDFEKKKTAYFTSRDGISPFALTTQVLRERRWTSEIVKRRQEELVDHLKRLWRL